MTKAQTLIINLPFAGFYESLYSSAVDSCQERDAEYMADEKEAAFAPELRITESEFNDIFFHVTDYSAAYRKLAESYVDAFDSVMSDEIGVPLKLQWESMDSPREYNFTTDRVYAHIPLSVVRKLFAISRKEKHSRLAAAIKGRFTSYDGFISGYRNELDTWLEKPLTDWDHNELGTLLMALMPDGRDWEMDVYYRTCDNEGDYDAWSNAVDWPAFEAKVADLRAEKEAELRAEDPDYVPPPVRCDRTPDMFTGRVGS